MYSPPVRSMARGIARSGRDCVMPGPARRCDGCCGSCDRTTCWRRHGLARRAVPATDDGAIIPDTVDAMWGTDLTTTITGEGQATVFIAVDHCAAECIGIHAHRQATRFQALEPTRQGVRQRFGGFGKAIARGLAVRHDHGSQYMSHHFQREIAFLAIESSPAFVRAPEGNGCAERFIRTLKENLLWVRTFETIEELRQALLEFRQTYNTSWLIERHGFLTPAQFRQKQVQTSAIAA